MDLFSVLITGANRGIGLEFVRQLVSSTIPPRHIFATYRNVDTIKELDALKKSAPSSVQVHLIKFDVRDQKDLDNLKSVVEERVGEKGLTILINNAGAVQATPFPNVTSENLDFHFQVNTIGPVLVAQKFLPLLKKAASLNPNSGMSFSKAGILNLSSLAASIANTGVIFPQDLIAPSYKASKAALNMMMRALAATVKDENVLIINMCPGWVKTDMGSDLAEIYPRESVAAMLNTISKVNENHHGTYLDRFGDPIPW